MTCLACEVLSLQTPPEIFAQDVTVFRLTLRAIADHQRDMDVKSFSSILQDIHGQTIHPFPTLEARLDELDVSNRVSC